MKRALISVFDKSGIIEFCKELVEIGWEIVSTGGTARALTNEGIDVTDVSEVTGFPECLDGRVKTLHPKLHGGLLAVRNNKDHHQETERLGIQYIDLVVCNLYPFKQTLAKNGVSHDEIIENIDIGGPSMLRAAAKNYKFVTVIVDPVDYKPVIEELRTNDSVSELSNLYLAGKVFQHTSHYDTLIANYFNKKNAVRYPDLLTMTFEKKQELRYGENPHQDAAFYNEVFEQKGTLSEAQQLHGKELSYNNINDTNGALETLKEFDEPTIVAVKHANPCGIGSADTIYEAFRKAYEADKVSIFGGIVASNHEIDKQTAEMINQIFIEVVIAPAYNKDALKILLSKKNIRILQLPTIKFNDYKTPSSKSVLGGMLLQDKDLMLLKEDLNVATKRKPTEKEKEDLIFAWKAVKHTKSNAIVLAKNKETVAIGPGQVSRIWALENCVNHAGDKAVNSVLASDAFFPFSDSVELAAKAGITAIIQPGGSIRDAESIDAANKHDIAMVFTGVRHFKH